MPTHRRRGRDAALHALEALRDGARAGANADRAGRFSCRGCVAWCCRSGHNAMRATALEAEAIANLLRSRGTRAVAEARRRCEEAVARHALAPGGDAPYECPFLTSADLCGVHEAKPLGCITFTPVRDGGCDQDGELLAALLGEVEALPPPRTAGAGSREGGAGDLPLPLAVLRALGGRSDRTTGA
jgi:Fe-S-cluster containining protein